MARNSKSPSERRETNRVDRRKFLKSLGGGAAGAATVVLAGAAPTPAAAAESAADKVKQRYRETPHIQAYYRTNRY